MALALCAAPAHADTPPASPSKELTTSLVPGQKLTGTVDVQVTVPAGLMSETTPAKLTARLGGTASVINAEATPGKECAAGCTVTLKVNAAKTSSVPGAEITNLADGPSSVVIEFSGSVERTLTVPVVIHNEPPEIKVVQPSVKVPGLGYATGKKLELTLSTSRPATSLVGAAGNSCPQPRWLNFTPDASHQLWTATLEAPDCPSGTTFPVTFDAVDSRGIHSTYTNYGFVVDHGMRLTARPEALKASDWSGLTVSFTYDAPSSDFRLVPVRVDAALDGKPWHTGAFGEEYVKSHWDGAGTGTLSALGDNPKAKPLPAGRHTLVLTVTDNAGVSSSVTVPVDIAEQGTGGTASPAPTSTAPTATATATAAPAATGTGSASGATAQGGGLAATGSDGMLPVMGAGAAALVLGTAGVFVARRRRSAGTGN